MQSYDYYSNPRRDVLGLMRGTQAGRILEIGGGDFPTLIEARARIGGEAWGVDIRASAAPLDRMIVGSVTSRTVIDQLSTAKFDVIIANDVVEHLEDTEGFFKVISEHLAVGGEILMSVPNVRNVKFFYHVFLRGCFPREDAGLFDRTHLRWFCRNDVETFSAGASLRVTDHRYGGRLIGDGALSRFRPFEFLALHNLFRLVRA